MTLADVPRTMEEDYDALDERAERKHSRKSLVDHNVDRRSASFGGHFKAADAPDTVKRLRYRGIARRAI